MFSKVLKMAFSISITCQRIWNRTFFTFKNALYSHSMFLLNFLQMHQEHYLVSPYNPFGVQPSKCYPHCTGTQKLIDFPQVMEKQAETAIKKHQPAFSMFEHNGHTRTSNPILPPPNTKYSLP